MWLKPAQPPFFFCQWQNSVSQMSVPSFVVSRCEQINRNEITQTVCSATSATADVEASKVKSDLYECGVWMNITKWFRLCGCGHDHHTAVSPAAVSHKFSPQIQMRSRGGKLQITAYIINVCVCVRVCRCVCVKVCVCERPRCSYRKTKI